MNHLRAINIALVATLAWDARVHFRNRRTHRQLQEEYTRLFAYAMAMRQQNVYLAKRLQRLHEFDAWDQIVLNFHAS